jgi:hypothetical protein
MSLPTLLPWGDIHLRLPVIFPPGTENRDHSIWEIAAKTIFVMLYAGAIQNAGVWIRPDQVTRMTDDQATKDDEVARLAWVKDSLTKSKGESGVKWYAGNTRESIRDDTIRYSLIPNGAVIERSGLATTSPAPRYALQADFAALLSPELDEATFSAKADAWRASHLNAGALARIALVRQGAITSGERVLVTFPNLETRSMRPGESANIAKAVIEVFAPRFLKTPGVIFLSESGNKVVKKDDDLAKLIKLEIPADKSLPDIILADLGPQHPLLVFVEVVWSDGPINELRKRTLLQITEGAGFPSKHVAFVTAFLDRNSGPFRKTVDSLAWGTYAWFVSEPDKLIVFQDKPIQIGNI